MKLLCEIMNVVKITFMVITILVSYKGELLRVNNKNWLLDNKMTLGYVNIQ